MKVLLCPSGKYCLHFTHLVPNYGLDTQIPRAGTGRHLAPPLLDSITPLLFIGAGRRSVHYRVIGGISGVLPVGASSARRHTTPLSVVTTKTVSRHGGSSCPGLRTTASGAPGPPTPPSHVPIPAASIPSCYFTSGLRHRTWTSVTFSQPFSLPPTSHGARTCSKLPPE